MADDFQRKVNAYWDARYARGIEAQRGETPQEARSEGRQPGAKHAPKGGPA